MPTALALPPQAFVHLPASADPGDEEIRASVRAALDYLGAAVAVWGVLAPGAGTDLFLAGAELVDNAQRHVGVCSVRVRWLPHVGRARLEVADTSPVLPMTAVPRGGSPCRGLQLVEDITARWGWEKTEGASGKVVFAEVTPEQSLIGDARLKALVRRHPLRTTDAYVASNIAVVRTIASAENREPVSAS